MVTIRAKDLAGLNDKQKCVLLLYLMEYSTIGIAIGLGADLLSHTSSSSRGFRFLGITLIVIGVMLVILCYITCSLARTPDLALAKSACCSVPLFVALAALGIFALAVSTKGGGTKIEGRSYKEFHVESYSNWMVKRVNDTLNWDNYYKNAVVKGNVCRKFGEDYELDTIDEFHKRSLDPFESGCCKPPEECNFNYTSPMVWVKPEKKGNYSNNDCKSWENDPKILCFNCQSCKAAFLQDLKSHWSFTGLFLVVLAAKQLFIGICFASLISYDS